MRICWPMPRQTVNIFLLFSSAVCRLLIYAVAVGRGFTLLLSCYYATTDMCVFVLQVDSDNTSERNRSVSDAGIAFPKLNTLDLSHNRLSDIPATISEHSKLTQLNLASNRLRDVSYSQYLMS